MGRKGKYSYEFKLEIVSNVFIKEKQCILRSKKHNIDKTILRCWIANYQSLGQDGLKTTGTNTKYSPELKFDSVLNYLNGEDSQ